MNQYKVEIDWKNPSTGNNRTMEIVADECVTDEEGYNLHIMKTNGAARAHVGTVAFRHKVVGIRKMTPEEVRESATYQHQRRQQESADAQPPQSIDATDLDDEEEDSDQEE